MGLFDSAKDFGKKTFNSADEASDKLRAVLTGRNPGVENLDVKFKVSRDPQDTKTEHPSRPFC